MKIKKIFHAILLFSFLIEVFGVQKAHALGTPQIVSINPSSPAQAGTSIRIRVRIDWDSEYRAMRIRFGNEGWQESSETEFERAFGTDNYSPGWYTIRVEAARIGDNDWANPTVAETQFEITGQPEPSKGPAISQFNFNPSGGAIVGNSVNIHIKIDSNNPGATTLTADCGGLSKNETSEVEFDSTWNTNGCPAQTVNILACSRAVDDPNWTNATCSTRSYTLSSPPVSVPVPTAQLWVDNNQVLKGQCTYLHWQTSNADRVDIDGNTVQNSGNQQVCPTVTKKYTLTATNQSGTANRNLTVIVSDQSSNAKVADYFQTGNIIQIGYDIYVIVNGERRLVPNPETLDALGITRSWIDNKGFGEMDLKTIPLGQDIPDVNRDPSGFAAFKNQYFQNSTPIIPGIEPTVPPAPNQPQEPFNEPWQVGTRVGLCAGAQIRSGSGFSYPTHTIVPENNWQVDIIDGPRENDGVTWWDISRKNIDGGGTGWVYFEQASSIDCNSALGNNTQSGDNQSENSPTQIVPIPEESVEQINPSETNPIWCNIFPLFCPTEASAHEGGPRPLITDGDPNFVQCTEYVQTQRRDVLCWLEPSSAKNPANAVNWLNQLDVNEKSIYGISHDDNPQIGDIAYWNGDCGMGSLGHVAYVVAVINSSNKIQVFEANRLVNSVLDGKIHEDYQEYTIRPNCMEFIHKPTTQIDFNTCQVITQPQQTQNSKLSFWAWLRKLFGIK